MQRREFITLLSGAASVWPLAARAQQPSQLRKLGILSGSAENDTNNRTWFAAFDDAFQGLGWKERENIASTRRYAPGDLNLTRAYAKELVALRPDLIFVTNTPAAMAVLEETHSIPTLFVNVSDPLGSGLVSSLARPGGNATGLTNFEFTMGGKWVQLMKELLPDVKRITVIFNPETAPFAQGYLRPAQAGAGSVGIELITAPVRDLDQLESTFTAQARSPGGSIMVIPDNFTVVNRERIISLSLRHRLPTVYPYRVFAVEGGLMAYGPDIADLYRRAATYADRILRGTKPAELPVEQPTKFELVINLKTARALGLEIPVVLHTIADELIE
jgi:putative ABC transport system substrate-binding protein